MVDLHFKMWFALESTSAHSFFFQDVRCYRFHINGLGKRGGEKQIRGASAVVHGTAFRFYS